MNSHPEKQVDIQQMIAEIVDILYIVFNKLSDIDLLGKKDKREITKQIDSVEAILDQVKDALR